jgi:starch phosphorylase
LNGWAIPTAARGTDADREDVERLYVLLERHVVPLFYDRNEDGVPVGFVQKMKHALRVAGSFFTARRMLQEYVTKYYVPAVCNVTADDPPTA